MPRDHRVEPSGFGLQIELRQIVQHINGNACDLDGFSFRQSARPRTLVDIAANRGHGRNMLELFKNLRRANITRMNDVAHSAQRIQCFRTKQSVGIGDDADDDGSSQFSVFPFMSSFISAWEGAPSIAV